MPHIPNELIQLAGIIFGQICHIIKKKTEETPNASESSIFYRYVLKRPFNTITSSLVGAGAAIGTAPVDVSGGMLFATAVITGIAANSMINRPGED